MSSITVWVPGSTYCEKGPKTCAVAGHPFVFFDVGAEVGRVLDHVGEAEFGGFDFDAQVSARVPGFDRFEGHFRFGPGGGGGAGAEDQRTNKGENQD